MRLKIACDSEKCENNYTEMARIETDTGASSGWQEYTDELYRCPVCRNEKTRRTEYDQEGFVLSDKIVRCRQYSKKCKK